MRAFFFVVVFCGVAVLGQRRLRGGGGWRAGGTTLCSVARRGKEGALVGRLFCCWLVAVFCVSFASSCHVVFSLFVLLSVEGLLLCGWVFDDRCVSAVPVCVGMGRRGRV